MKKTYKFLLPLAMPLADGLMVLLSGLVSYGVYRMLGIGRNAAYPFDTVFKASLLTGMTCVFILFIFGGYNKDSGILNVMDVKNTLKGITVSFMVVAALLVLLNIQIPRYVIVFTYILAVSGLITVKTALNHMLPLAKGIQGLNTRILIYGAGELGQALFKNIACSPRLGITPVGMVDDDPLMQGKSVRSGSFSHASMTIKVLGKGPDIPRLVHTLKVDEVVVAISNIDNQALIRILRNLRQQGILTAFIPNLYKAFVHQVSLHQIGQLPIVRERQWQISFWNRLTKRALDIGLSLILVLALSPVFVMIAVCIRKESKGPVFFIHKRIGLNGAPFDIIKFRTMYRNTPPYAVNPADDTDPRITRVGRFLRKTSLDELPQLFNVLKGEMALVGPRPEMPFIVESYTERQRLRLAIRPGITGLWQLSADRSQPIHENMEYDLYYINNGSFFLDLAILIETTLFAFKGI